MKSLSSTRAFTRVELILVVIMVALGLMMLLPVMRDWSRPQVRGHGSPCSYRLLLIGVSFLIFSNEHDDKYPMQVSTNSGGTREFVGQPSQMFRHFVAMSNAISSPMGLICPQDSRKPATNFTHLDNRNVSYFIGLDADETRPGMLLAGDRNLQVAGAPLTTGIHRLGTNGVVGWTREMHSAKTTNSCGHVLRADGSVSLLTDAGLRQALRASDDVANRIVIP